MDQLIIVTCRSLTRGSAGWVTVWPGTHVRFPQYHHSAVTAAGEKPFVCCSNNGEHHQITSAPWIRLEVSINLNRCQVARLPGCQTVAAGENEKKIGSIRWFLDAICIPGMLPKYLDAPASSPGPGRGFWHFGGDPL